MGVFFLKPHCFYKPGLWGSWFFESGGEKMGWFPIIEHMEGRVLTCLDEQMFFHLFNAFLTLWNTNGQQPACSVCDFFSQPWICCGAIFRWQRNISTVWTQFPVYDILEVNQNATSLREQLWHSFWGAWLGLSLSVCLSNSNLNCRNCKPVSLMKSSGLLQRGV